MKKYAFTFTASAQFSQPVHGHGFLLRCMPGTFPFQRSYAHKLVVKPYAALTLISDVYGNEMYSGNIDKAHTSFSYTASGFVLSSKYLTHDPLDRLYLYPSRLTQPSPGMVQMIRSAALPSDPWARAKALCTLTHRLMHFTMSNGSKTAAEAFASGHGNARDYAHVYLALCRLSGIAARFVNGLAVGIPQAHAWAEVYCGGLWRAIDPSAGCEVSDGYLKIAHGPDYHACAVERSCFAESDVVPLKNVHVQVTEHVIRTRDTVPHA